MTKVRKKIGNIPINTIKQDLQSTVDTSIAQMQKDVTDFIDKETAQYPEIGAAFKFQEDPEGRSEITTDAEGKIISYRDNDGVKHEEVGIETDSATVNHLNLTENGMTEFQQALKDSGFDPGYVGDFSDESYIYLQEQPGCAVMNISGTDVMPTAKNQNIHAWAEVYDMNGNYFKKRIILDGQGDSSMHQYKKNFACDFCNDEWIGDDTPKIKIGNWVSQDSFHFKAYYTDLYKIANVTCYKIWDSFRETMPFIDDKPYKKYFSNKYNALTLNESDFNQNSNDEARCVPDGFPVMVYLNGAFYGLFSWQLKKHRDNYYMDRNKTSHIHIDGDYYEDMFRGNIRWNRIEIRNPKPKKSKWTLYCMDGSKYDGDNPKELIDETSAVWDGNNTSHIKSAEVKANVIGLSQYMGEIAPYETAYEEAMGDEAKAATLTTLKAEIEKRFAVKWMIDYLLLINFVCDSDSIGKNVQWVTWGKINGKMLWNCVPYDMDQAFGIASVLANTFYSPLAHSFGSTEHTPLKYCYLYYDSEMKSRWAELRRNNIINVERIFGYIKDWIYRIGLNNYNLEYKKWDESPCNRSNQIDSRWEITGRGYSSLTESSTNWTTEGVYGIDAMVKYENRLYKSLQSNNVNHVPAIGGNEWWTDLSPQVGTYTTGNTVYDGYTNFLEFRALEDITVAENSESERFDGLVNTPYIKFYSHYPFENGTFDSLYRTYIWLGQSIAAHDAIYNYNS